MYLIASYPKSGNHFVRYIVETLTRRPTLGAGPIGYMHKYDAPIYVRLRDEGHYRKGHYELEDAIAIKKHGSAHAPNKITEEDESRKLILIVRNYKEVIPRFCPKCGDFLNPVAFLDSYHISALSWYAGLLETYNSWPQSKMIVYYADLITDTEKEVERIDKFLGDDAIMDADGFNKDLQFHRNRSLGACLDRRTNGDQVIYHSKDIKEEWLVLMRDYLAQNHPIAYTYLQRFE